MNQALPIVWITGAGGLVGTYLVQTAARYEPSWAVRGLTRADLDLTDVRAVRSAFQADAPQMVIHCAALSQTPACEKDPALARKLNVEVTALLAELAADIPLIFFSTDLVFDGRAGNYDESSAPNPLSVYGKTKLEAEKIVLANPKHTAVRMSLNFGRSPRGDRSFNEQMRRAIERGETLKLFTDEFRCPMAAVETARAVWELAAKNRTGLYHLAGVERLSRWEIGRLLVKHWRLDAKIEPVSVRDVAGCAPRSPDTSLNCNKVQSVLSFPLPRFSEWLVRESSVKPL